MRGSRGVVRMRQWWSWGGALVRHKAGEGAGVKKTGTGPPGLDFRYAIRNGDGER